jgi:hypothetical protein
VTTAFEATPTEQLRRRAVVYLYTQTGQLREVAQALTAPLEAHGWDIRWVDVRPRHAFPFPWPVRRFFGAFPQVVDPEAVVELVEPSSGFDTAADELVILAYQVWYLAPSLPIRSLLKMHPETVRDRSAVSLIACRNMWYSAAIEMSGLLKSAGARRVDVVAATDTRGSSTSLVTTLRWLLTGKRAPFLWFGRAIVPALAAADMLAGRAFRKWGATVRSMRRFGGAAHAASLITFVLSLGIAIAVGLPLIGVAAVIGGERFATRVRGFVHGRIAFNLPISDEAAIS